METLFTCVFICILLGYLWVIFDANKCEIYDSWQKFLDKHALYRIVKYEWYFNHRECERYYIEKRFLLFFYKRMKVLYEVENYTDKDNFTYYKLKKRNEDYFNTFADAETYLVNFFKKSKKTIIFVKN